MDQERIVETLGRLAGVVTALEAQTHALLLAALAAGVYPDVLVRAVHAVPEPRVPPTARDAYESAMAGFRRRLDEAALELLARDLGREGGSKGEGA